MGGQSEQWWKQHLVADFIHFLPLHTSISLHFGSRYCLHTPDTIKDKAKHWQNYLSVGVQIVLCILSEANLFLQPEE